MHAIIIQFVQSTKKIQQQNLSNRTFHKSSKQAKNSVYISVRMSGNDDSAGTRKKIYQVRKTHELHLVSYVALGHSHGIGEGQRSPRLNCLPSSLPADRPAPVPFTRNWPIVPIGTSYFGQWDPGALSRPTKEKGVLRVYNPRTGHSFFHWTYPSFFFFIEPAEEKMNYEKNEENESSNSARGVIKSQFYIAFLPRTPSSMVVTSLLVYSNSLRILQYRYRTHRFFLFLYSIKNIRWRSRFWYNPGGRSFAKLHDADLVY